jgi:hypothetical protein
MKLLNTDRGIARLLDDGTLEVLDTPHTELGQAMITGVSDNWGQCKIRITGVSVRLVLISH